MAESRLVATLGGLWHVPVPVTTSTSAPDVVITATLTGYEIALDPAQPEIQAGQHVLFIIPNEGKHDHGFLIMGEGMASRERTESPVHCQGTRR